MKNKKNRKKKMEFDSDKAFTNAVILMSIITTVAVIVKIATNGISFFSTIGYFG